MYSVDIKPDLRKKFRKLKKKDPKQFWILRNKIEEIILDPHRYKNLKAPHNDWKRVKIQYRFVLTFSIDEEAKTVTLEDYLHRDKIYLN